MRRDGRAEEHTVEGDVRGHKDLIEAILKRMLAHGRFVHSRWPKARRKICAFKMAEGMEEDLCI